MLKRRPVNHDVLLLLHFIELKSYFVHYAEENIIEFWRHLKMTPVEDSCASQMTRHVSESILNRLDERQCPY
jgi:hypothetical protein